MPKLFIGQLHQCNSSERSNFDACYPGATEMEVIKAVQLETIGRLVSMGEDDLKVMGDLLHCKTAEELSNWFYDNMAFYSFCISSEF